MAVIYSYPKATPTASDLLIGTLTSDASGENPTKSFSISDIIGLVPAAGTGGTVTSVGLTTNATASGTSNPFFTISNTPITTNGNINIDLNTSGTPSATTFLNGNGEWAAPVGTGTQTTYGFVAVNNAPNVDINLTASPAGTVQAVRLIPSAPVTITADSSSNITIGSLAVTTVTAAAAAGTATVPSFIQIGGSTQSPTVALTASGLGSPAANYSLRGDGTWGLITTGGTMSSWDLLADSGTQQNIVEGEDVKIVGGTGIDTAIADNAGVAEVTVNLAATVPVSLVAGTTVQDTSTAAENVDISGSGAITVKAKNVVSNNSDTFTSYGRITNIISLTAAEYAALVAAGTTDANTLYIAI